MSIVRFYWTCSAGGGRGFYAGEKGLAKGREMSYNKVTKMTKKLRAHGGGDGEKSGVFAEFVIYIKQELW